MDTRWYSDRQQSPHFETGRPVFNWNHLLVKPRTFLFANFRAKVPILIEKGNYIIKTAENGKELEQALKLRHDVFIQELLGRRNFLGVDIDKYDPHCDHLMIIDKKNGACVGCYRLNSDRYSRMFYSEKEFHLGTLMALAGTKLEIGRACIKREYRKKNMMGLIWEGVYHYVATINARYIFGCSSIMTIDPLEVAILYRYLSRHDNYRDDLHVRPQRKYRQKGLYKLVTGLDFLDSETVCGRGEQLVPQLIKDYFRCGAVVCGEPALDKAFKCTDVFTLLDMDRLNGAYLDTRTMQ